MAVSRWPASVVAEVLSVSAVVVEGRAVVMVVSCGPASVVAVVSWVSKSLCHCVLSAKKFTPHGLVWARSPARPYAAHAGAPGAVAPGAPGNK